MSKTKLTMPLQRRREQPEIRRNEIIDAALRIAGRIGAQGLKRNVVAEEAGVSSTLLHKYFAGMDLMREIVIETAFKRRDTDVLYKSLSIEDFKRLNRDPDLVKHLCNFLTG